MSVGSAVPAAPRNGTLGSRPPDRVAVIGGGFAGLAAAYRLASAGAAVSLFEKSGHLGGLAMTFRLGETEIEKYYHHWFTSDHDVLDLVAELGLADRVRWGSPVMGMFHRGRVYRFTSPADLLRFRPFSLRAKTRFALVTLFLQTYPRPDPFEGVTAADWLRRWAGREVYETIWGPLLRAKFGRHAETISMAWIWSKMRLRGRSRRGGGTRESLGYFDGGFGVVARELVEAIRRRGGQVHTAERVERIQSTLAEGAQASLALPPLAGPLGPAGDDRFELVTSKRRERFAAAISTVAPPILATIAPDLDPDYRRRLAGIEYGAIACTLLVLKRQFSPIYWMNVSDAEVPFGGLIEHTNYISPATYGGRHILYVSHYVYADDPVFTLDARALYEHYRPALRRIRSGFDDDWVVEQRTFRDRWAQPIVTADYHRRRLPLEAPVAGLYVATMAQVYPEDRGTNYAVRIGSVAARRVLDDLDRERPGAGERRLASGRRS